MESRHLSRSIKSSLLITTIFSYLGTYQNVKYLLSKLSKLGQKFSQDNDSQIQVFCKVKLDDLGIYSFLQVPFFTKQPIDLEVCKVSASCDEIEEVMKVNEIRSIQTLKYCRCLDSASFDENLKMSQLNALIQRSQKLELTKFNQIGSILQRLEAISEFTNQPEPLKRIFTIQDCLWGGLKINREDNIAHIQVEFKHLGNLAEFLVVFEIIMLEHKLDLDIELSTDRLSIDDIFHAFKDILPQTFQYFWKLSFALSKDFIKADFGQFRNLKALSLQRLNTFDLSILKCLPELQKLWLYFAKLICSDSEAMILSHLKQLTFAFSNYSVSEEDTLIVYQTQLKFLEKQHSIDDLCIYGLNDALPRDISKCLCSLVKLNIEVKLENDLGILTQFGSMKHLMSLFLTINRRNCFNIAQDYIFEENQSLKGIKISFLRSDTLKHKNDVTIQILKKFLRSITNLKELEIQNSQFSSKGDLSFYRFLSKSHPTLSLKIDTWNQFSQDMLLGEMCYQSFFLTKLTLRHTAYHTRLFFITNMLKHNKSLSELTIQGNYRKQFKNRHNEFFKAIKLHPRLKKMNFELIEMFDSIHLLEEIYSYVEEPFVTCCQNLKEVQLDFGSYSVGNTKFDGQKFKSEKMQMLFVKKEFYKKVISQMPNLEKLTL